MLKIFALLSCLAAFAVNAQTTTIALTSQSFPEAKNNLSPVGTVRFSLQGQALLVTAHFPDAEIASLRSTRNAPDNISSNETSLQLLFDIAGDRKRGRYFTITPLGGVEEGLFREGGDGDNGFDFPWEASATIEADGWRARFLIPLTSLGRTAAMTGVPAVLLTYRRQASSMSVFHNKNPKDFGNCNLCAADSLAMLAQSASTGGEWTAKLSSFFTRATSEQTTQNRFSASLDASWRPSSDSLVGLAIKPNFYEREPDSPVLQKSAQFSPSLSETRQLFARGSDLYQAEGFSMINTRNLASPNLALSGTLASTNWRTTGLLVDDAGKSWIIMPSTYGNSAAAAPNSKALIARGLANFDKTDVNATGLLRDYGSLGQNAVLGIDGNHALSDSWRIYGAAAANRSTACGVNGQLQRCDPSTGSAFFARAKHQSGDNGEQLQTWIVSDHYRNDLGWQTQSGFRKLYANAWRNTSNVNDWLKRAGGAFDYNLSQSSSGKLIEHSLQFSGDVVTPVANFWLYGSPFAVLRLSEELPLINQTYIGVGTNFSPAQWIPKIWGEITYGRMPDYANRLAGHGFNLSSNALIAPLPGYTAQLKINWYRTTGDLPVAVTGPTLEERQMQLALNWQLATFSRLRYVVSHSHQASQVFNNKLLSKDTSNSLAQSLLYAHAPRLGWGWTVGITQTKQVAARSREVFAKLSYSL
jgi:hypothetical protein